jgi:hypothetical protein
MAWIPLGQDEDKLGALVEAVIHFRLPLYTGNSCLTSHEKFCFMKAEIYRRFTLKSVLWCRVGRDMVFESLKKLLSLCAYFCCTF